MITQIRGPADLIFVGGNVITMDSHDSIAQAMATTGPRIVAVGSTTDVLRAADSHTTIVDVPGTSLIPGIVDNHIHTANAWQRVWVDCRYPRGRSIDEIVELIAEAAAKAPSGSWVIGRGFEPGRLVEGRTPNRHDLDRGAPAHLVGLCNREGMGWTFNTLGLRAVGVNDTTADPPGGPLERDDRGVPLGPMWDNARTVFVVPNIPRPSDDEVVAGFEWMERELLSFGVTTAHEAGYKEARHARGWQMVRTRRSAGLRVVLGPYPIVGDAWDEDSAPGSIFRSGLSSGFGDEWLRLGSLQMGVDGGLIGATAALSLPYANRSDGYRGSFRVDQSTLDAAVRRADDAGWGTGLICQGDAGIERSLTAIARLGSRQKRHRLEHAYLWTPKLMDEMARLAVAWNTQPGILPLTGPYLTGLFGERARWAFPFRSMLERGVTVSGGSDWGVGEVNPFLGIDALVNHRSDLAAGADPFMPEERVPLMSALRIYTMGGALAGDQESEIGSLEVGKLADIAIADADLTSIPVEMLSGVRVRQTYVGGNLVFDRSHADAS